MEKIIVIHILMQDGSARLENYRNNAAGRTAARDSMRYHMQMCLNGDTKAITVYAEAASNQTLIEA